MLSLNFYVQFKYKHDRDNVLVQCPTKTPLTHWHTNHPNHIKKKKEYFMLQNIITPKCPIKLKYNNKKSQYLM